MSTLTPQTEDFPFGALTTYSISDSDFNDFVNRQYGFAKENSELKHGPWGYFFSADQEACGDDIIPFDARDDMNWDNYAPQEKEKFDSWIAGNGEPYTNMADYLFQDLCTRGIIPPGRYQIFVN